MTAGHLELRAGGPTLTRRMIATRVCFAVVGGHVRLYALPWQPDQLPRRKVYMHHAPFTGIMRRPTGDLVTTTTSHYCYSCCWLRGWLKTGAPSPSL